FHCFPPRMFLLFPVPTLMNGIALGTKTNHHSVGKSFSICSLFFQDSGKPEALEFLTMVKNIPDIPFGICTSSQVLSHYNITQNTISLFRKVDNKRQDLEIQDGNKVDVAKLSRFIRINELRWVTEYNPMTAVGLFDSAVQTHLLLFSDKTSSLHTERINKYREAAVAFQGKALFILVDLSIKDNDRVLSYFHLKKSQLPALAAYYTADEEQDVLLLDEVSVERITDFCHAFLQRKEEVSVQNEFLHT
uniref:Endoplasmic reticulum protein 27 n=1 Tax=Laticauda laticaudata TaxID=8630 RepID=A0A8C5SNI3_LATLA